MGYALNNNLPWVLIRYLGIKTIILLIKYIIMLLNFLRVIVYYEQENYSVAKVLNERELIKNKSFLLVWNMHYIIIFLGPLIFRYENVIILLTKYIIMLLTFLRGTVYDGQENYSV